MADVLVGRRAVLSALANHFVYKDWQEAQHPRIPRRHLHGGRFTRRGGGLPSDLEDQIAAHGGATVDPRTSSYIIHGTVVATGINSHLVDATRFSSDPAWAQAQIYDYLKTNRDDISSHPTHHLGFWYDEANSEIAFDVVEVTDRETAVRLGRERGEQAVWDLDRNEPVDTGGSGGRENLEVAKERADRARRRFERVAEGRDRRRTEGAGSGDRGQGQQACDPDSEAGILTARRAALSAVTNHFVQKSLAHRLWDEHKHPRIPHGEHGGEWTSGGWSAANLAELSPPKRRPQLPPAALRAAADAARERIGDPNAIVGKRSKIDAYHEARYIEAGNALIEASKGNLRPLREIANWEWEPMPDRAFRNTVEGKAALDEYEARVGWWQMHPRQRQTMINDIQYTLDHPKEPARWGQQTPEKAGFLGQSWIEAPRLYREDYAVLDVDPRDGGPTAATLEKVDHVKAVGEIVAGEIDTRMRVNRTTIEEHVAPLTNRLAQLTEEIGETNITETRLHDEWQVIKDQRRAEGFEGKSIDLPEYEAFRAKIKVLHQEQDRIIDQRRALDKQIGEARAEWSNAQRVATIEVLESIRPLSTSGLTLNYGGARGSTEREELRTAMNWASTHYPAEWVAASDARGPLLVDLMDRGRYVSSGGRGVDKVFLSTWDGETPGMPKRGRVAVHELGHRMEDVVPGLKALEWAYHWQRTSTPTKSKTAKLPRRRIGKNALTTMPGYDADEKSRGDHFRLMYTGKVYTDSPDSPWEVFTTSVEALFAGRDYNDPDLRAFALGALATLMRKP